MAKTGNVGKGSRCDGSVAAGLALALLAAAAPAAAQSGAVPTRGELLYDTHCGACHGMQMHWRDQRAVRDWASLTAQVQLWQGTLRLQWSPDDIAAVARHLNDTIYHLPRPAQRQGRVPGAPPTAG